MRWGRGKGDCVQMGRDRGHGKPSFMSLTTMGADEGDLERDQGRRAGVLAVVGQGGTAGTLLVQATGRPRLETAIQKLMGHWSQ